MKKFARCVLILILVTVLSGVIGYAVSSNNITSMYTSTAQLYVVPGSANEASLRSANGSLNEDFAKLITSNVVISDAQQNAGTSENIAQYITVVTPANSNLVEITCTNPDQNTAKLYVDAVAKSAIKITSIIPVEKISILSEGTSTGMAIKPDLEKITAFITICAAAITAIVEVIVVMFIVAFKKKEVDDEEDYYKNFVIPQKLMLSQNMSGNSDYAENTSGTSSVVNSRKHKTTHDDIIKDVLQDEDDFELEDILNDGEDSDEVVVPFRPGTPVASNIPGDMSPEIKQTTVEETEETQEMTYEDLYDDDSYEEDSYDDDSNEIDTIQEFDDEIEADNTSNNISESAMDEVAVTREESSTEILGRIPR